MIPYRPEIDGLRAIAVLPIVLFHAGVEALSGGFVGVDIFFVISGYLIGSIILDELSQGRFSFERFYRRRMRRILPALLFMVAITLGGGSFLLLPDEWMDLARSAVAALLFVPNISFWLASSTYFGLDVATQPLLHTWSLGVEEQFYLIIPALLVFLHARARGAILPLSLLVLCAASFWLNLYWMGIDAKFSFYMLPARAWELLVGVTLAWGLPRYVPGRRSGAAAALLGLVLCIAPVFLLSEHSPFPGSNALYPVMGAALIILGTSGAPACVVSRVLSSALPIALGRMSYSLYLWHWPVIVYMELARPSGSNTLPTILISIVLATLSYRFIEARYRHLPAGASGISRGRLRELQTVMGMTATACIVLVLTGGLPGRIPMAAWEVAGNTAAGEDYGDCEVLSGDPSLEAVRCRLGQPDQPVTVALWGDSHANALAPGLDTALHRAGRAGYLYFGSGCRPLLAVSRPSRTRCPRFNAAVAAQIAAHPGISTVYLAGYWRLPLMGQSYDNANFLIRDSESMGTSPVENRAVFRRGLRRTVSALGERRVVIVEDIPEIGSQFGKSVANHFVREDWLDIDRQGELGFRRPEGDAYPSRFQAILASAPPGLGLLRLQNRLCAGNLCPLMIDDTLLYYDGDHLSEAGSLYLSSLFYGDLEGTDTARASSAH